MTQIYLDSLKKNPHSVVVEKEKIPSPQHLPMGSEYLQDEFFRENEDPPPPPPQFQTIPFTPSYKTAKGVIGRKKPVTSVCTFERKFSHSYEIRQKQASFMRAYRQKIHPAKFISLLQTCATIASQTLKQKLNLN